MGIARALGNLIGNCVATVAIASWEGDIDRERAHKVLNGEKLPQDTAQSELSTPHA
jgi:aerobic C4-dicarboxylate transport protein